MNGGEAESQKTVCKQRRTEERKLRGDQGSRVRIDHYMFNQIREERELASMNSEKRQLSGENRGKHMRVEVRLPRWRRASTWDWSQPGTRGALHIGDETTAIYCLIDVIA
ncbi:uncharacterized protein DS421_18g630150 [Arachis hypogaea]|nr:uncharacterized protein DS421_18g630150 [Arachis hypogaea]